MEHVETEIETIVHMEVVAMARHMKRVSLPLTIAGADKLQDLADAEGVTQAEILRRALRTYDYLKSAGGKIQVKKKSGDVVEVVLP